MNDIYKVTISKKAYKSMLNVPMYISLKLKFWITSVGIDGLYTVRKIKSFHDEPLKGIREGQRSIRLSKSYRAIYIVFNDNECQFVEIQEIHNHEY